MHSDHKILIGAGALLLAMTGTVFAASTFYAATAGSGLNFAAISDASGHLGQQMVVCDAAAMASCQNVTSGSASVSVTNAPAVKLQDGGGTAITSDTRGTSRPLAVEILDASGNQITSFGGGAGGTNFGSAFPTAGTAIGMTQGGNMTALTGTAGSLNINCTAGCSGANNSVATPPTLPPGAQQLGVNVSGTFTALTGHGTSMDVNITNLNNNGQAASSASAPVTIANDQMKAAGSPSTTQVMSIQGEAGMTPVQVSLVTSANSSTSGAIAPSTTPTGVNLKASAGAVTSIQLGGIGSTPAYLKLYNKATAPTCGTDTPVKRLIIPAAATAANGAGSNISFSSPIGFSLGIGYCLTGGLPDADTTAVAANTILVNIDWQ